MTTTITVNSTGQQDAGGNNLYNVLRRIEHGDGTITVDRFANVTEAQCTSQIARIQVESDLWSNIKDAIIAANGG